MSRYCAWYRYYLGSVGTQAGMTHGICDPCAAKQVRPYVECRSFHMSEKETHARSHQWTTIVGQARLLIITRNGPQCRGVTASDEHSLNMGSEAYVGALYQSAKQKPESPHPITI
jgi:hypothetical protein